MNRRFQAFGAACSVIFLALTGTVSACPFCNVESQTLSEEINGADAVVFAKLVKDAPANSDSNDPNAGMATFQVVDVLKGKEKVAGNSEIKVVFFGDSDRSRTYMITGLGKDKIDWTTPLPLSPAAIDYVRKLQSVPPAGIERLVFFQDYLENADPLLSQDAYDEFGRAPYNELHDLGPKMQHDRILKWVADPEVSPSRRRLYLTMLGVCGSKADVPLLEGMIVSDFDAMKPLLVAEVGTGMLMGGPVGMPIGIEAVQQDERRKKLGLDALVACYLILRGPDGLDLVEDRFLKNPHAEYTHVYSTIMALRFHGDQNTGVVPRDKLLGAMRLLLKNPDFADQVILDLSRWEDWSVLDQLVEMFKHSDAKGYVRQPVVSYLTVASEQEGDVGTRAKAALAELEKLDPETVKTAKSLMAFGALGRARGAAAAASASAKNSAASQSKVASTTAADNAQAYAASPADEKTDTSKIPDPAVFDPKGGGAPPAGPAKTAESAANSTTKANPATSPAVVKMASSGVPSPTDSAAPSSANKPATINLILVAGVPLAAAVLLVGVYWLVLRAGAV